LRTRAPLAALAQISQEQRRVRRAMEQEAATALAAKQEEVAQLGEGILHHFEQILHQDSLIDEVGFLHPTQFQSLEHSQTSNWTFEVPECPQRYLWCKDHKLAISTEILPKLYRAAQHAYSNSAAAKDGSFMETDLMRHSKALLILCPDMLTAWNSR
jgi:protein prenyltransferase alpha subunit repeat containing protein 1